MEKKQEVKIQTDQIIPRQLTDLEMRGKLMAKMSEVIKLTGNVEKKGQNKDQGYKYATHSDIIEEIRKHVADQKLFILPRPNTYTTDSILSRNGAKGTLITMSMDFDITDTETGFSINVRWFGQGMDYGDKAIYKAYTGALKYFLLDTFMISTGDDPEKESPAEQVTHPTPTARPATTAYVTPKMTAFQKGKILDLCARKGKTELELFEAVKTTFKLADWLEMNIVQANAIVKKLETLPDIEEIEPKNDEPDIDLDEVAKGIENKEEVIKDDIAI